MKEGSQVPVRRLLAYLSAERDETNVRRTEPDPEVTCGRSRGAIAGPAVVPLIGSLAVPQKYNDSNEDNQTREKKYPPRAMFFELVFSTEELPSTGNTVRRLVVLGYHPAVWALDHLQCPRANHAIKQRARGPGSGSIDWERPARKSERESTISFEKNTSRKSNLPEVRV